MRLGIDNTELKGVIEATKILAQTLSNYSYQEKIFSISNTLVEITKDINSLYIFDMCSTIAKNYHNQIKTLYDSLTNIKLDRMIVIQNIMQRTIEYIKENCELNSCVEYKSNLFKELSQATGYIVRDERENAVELVENALPAKISKKGIEMMSLFEKVQKLDLSLVTLTPNTCGAIGGMFTPFFGAVTIGFITGAVSTAITMGLSNITGESNYELFEIVGSSLVIGMVSGLTAGIVDNIKIPKLNAGRNSLNAISKQINTKLIKGTINNVSRKTLSKMFTLNFLYSLPFTTFNTAFSILNMRD